jgi:hypothetical protein
MTDPAIAGRAGPRAAGTGDGAVMAGRAGSSRPAVDDRGSGLVLAGDGGVGDGDGLVLVGHFRQFRWTALPMALGLAGLLVGLERLGATLPWLGAAAVLYALLVWRLGIAVLAQPLTWRAARLLSFAAPGGGGGRRQAEDSLHGGAVLVAAVVVAASPALALTGWAAPVLWPGLLYSACCCSGWRARITDPTPHAYAALLTLTVGVWLTDAWWAAPDCGSWVNR